MPSEPIKPVAEEPDCSDDDDIYDANVVELKSGHYTNHIPLYEPVMEYRDGAIKSTIEVSERGQHLHHKSKSDCSVSVTRLVWADGWRYNGQDEPMTLVVLKLGFKPESPSAKITYASLQLRLKSDRLEDDDPQLIAWGPFRHPEMWNVSQSHRRVNVTPNVKLGVGVAGQELSIGVERTKEDEWDQTHTDYGLSSEKYNKYKKESPNGVLWQIFQNELLNRGITPEVRVAALFSRPPSAYYRAEVRIIATTGMASGLIHKGMRFFNQSGGDKIYWRITVQPGSQDKCYAEGRDIIKQVDLNNLHKLVDHNDSTELSSEWLNKWDRVEMPKAMAVSEAQPLKAVTERQPIAPAAARGCSSLNEVTHSRLEGGEASKNRLQTRRGSLGDDRTASLATRTPPQASSTRENGDNIQPQVSGATEVIDAASQPLDFDCRSRLVALEDRAARAEARIAEQEQHMTELQRTLTRVAQALLANDH